MPYIGRAPTSTATKLEDADQDTKIQVEESSDEDTIRFDTGGSERMTVASGGTVDVVGDLTVGTVTADGDTSAGDTATIGYTSAEGLILTGQGSTDDITIKNDADTTVVNVGTGGTDVEISAGNLLFGTASKGVYLGVTSATAANLLDDYEEGLHVATLTAYGSGNWVMNASYDTLSYTKVGRLVHVQGLLTAASDNSASGQLVISLPFTQLATSEGGSHSKPFMLIYDHGDGGIENAYCSNSPGASETYGANITDAGAAEAIDHSRLDAAFSVNINMCYYAA